MSDHPRRPARPTLLDARGRAGVACRARSSAFEGPSPAHPVPALGRGRVAGRLGPTRAAAQLDASAAKDVRRTESAGSRRPPRHRAWNTPTMPARRFGATARVALFLAAEGRCARCGAALAPGWHADHVEPVRTGGPTTPANGQALCPQCNLRKGGRAA